MSTHTTGHPRRPGRPTPRTEHRATFKTPTRPDPTATRQEVWAEHSPDGLWSFHRLDGVPGTPWEVVYNPTGQNTLVTTRREARSWTATPAALAYFVREAQEVIDRRGALPGDLVAFHQQGLTDAEYQKALADMAEACRDRVHKASRWLLIHRGQMLPAGGDQAPESRCTCGGYLAWVAGLWRHIDSCAECYDPAAGWVLPCHDRMRLHVACLSTEPVTCDHLCCARPLDLTRQPCPKGMERCCGCCEDES